MSDLGEEFAQSLERVLTDHNTTHQPSSSRTLAWSEQLWGQLDTLGVPLLLVDADEGGAGGQMSDLFDVLTVAGRFATPAPVAEEILAQWLAVQHNFDRSSGLTTLAIAGDALSFSNQRLSGEVESVPWGRAATRAIIVLNNPEPTLVLAHLDATKDRTNLSDEPSDTLLFDKTQVIGATPSRYSVDEIRRLGALARSAQMCGAMHGVLDMTMRYVSDREQFGRPLKKFQAIQHHLAIMYSDVVAANTATRGALTLAAPEKAAFESAAAIVRTREAATRVAATAHQAHGAIGFTADYTLGRLTKRLWAWRDEYGDERWWRESLGELVLQNSEPSLWELLTDASG